MNNDYVLHSILVVDDEKFICDLCYDSLSQEGFKVETTSNPKTVIKKLTQNRFDLVLTDIKMPRMDGLELVKRVKSKYPDLPIVIMTGFPTIDSAVQALNEGANNYVRKPFSIEELITAVKKTLENRQLLQENIRLKTQVNFFKLNEKINSLQEPSKINTLLLNTAINETGADRGGIFEVDYETEQIFLRYGVNLQGRIEYGTKFKKYEGLAGQILKKKSPVIIESWQSTNSNFTSIGEEKWSHSAIGVPLRCNELINYILCLYKKNEHFSAADVDGAMILAIEASIALNNADLVLDLEILFLETIKSLAQALDERDPYTHGHSKRVGQIAVTIGKVMGLLDKQLDELELAGNLHDIGKIGIRDSVLFKKGQLTAKEYEIIKTHAEKGYNILKNIKRLSSVVDAVYSHHEWFNGQGYPRGLKKGEIPLAGAIIAVADAFDTMVTDRRYQKKIGYTEAMKILEENAGKQFNKNVVRALRQVPKKELPL